MTPRHTEYRALLLVLFVLFAAQMAQFRFDLNGFSWMQNGSSADIPQFTKLIGKASWYGVPFHGRLTANGEIYDMNTLTAAHKTLPFDSLVKVTNLANNESVIVRINDRGPYVHGRNIDLSYQAAKHLNMVGAGVAPVKLEILAATNKFVYRGHKYSQSITRNR